MANILKNPQELATTNAHICKEVSIMYLNEFVQALSSLTSIAMITIGSLWLKQYLRTNFV